MKNAIKNILTAAALAGFVSGTAAAPRPVSVAAIETTAPTSKGQ